MINGLEIYMDSVFIGQTENNEVETKKALMEKCDIRKPPFRESMMAYIGGGHPAEGWRG